MEPITAADLLCPCCKKGNPHPSLIDGINLMQELIQQKITIDSACRCPAHNAAVGGAPHSEHLLGQAADMKAEPYTPLELYLIAEQIPAFINGGIGLYPANFIHVDVRQHRARWYRVAGHDNPITDYVTQHAHL